MERNYFKLNPTMWWVICLIAVCLTLALGIRSREMLDAKSKFTGIIVKNSSAKDSVKVYVTCQSTDSVVGMFGIVDSNTIGGNDKGFFYAHKNVSYLSNRNRAVNGLIISFEGDNQGCENAVYKGFKSGINIFECTLNVPFESFDTSCEDGVNCVIKVSVSDKFNWSTGYSTFQKVFTSSTNNMNLGKNCNIRGVFPYMCTDCIQLGTQPPSNCFKLKTKCSSQRTCQVARTNHNGGTVTVEYMK